MPITAPPTIPLITDPATFATRAQDWVVWQSEQLYPELIAQSALLGLSMSSVSTSSVLIGTGSKSFTVETGKGFGSGQSLVIARTSAPTNRMFGVVTSYNSVTGALVFESQAIEGSGTFTDWTISPTLNAVLTAAQIPDLLITNAKLDNAYVNHLTTVTLDNAADYFAIADGSDTGKKKKALIPSASDTVKGIAELATSAEAIAGIDDATIVTPLKLRNGLNASGAAPVYACRAWVNFNGTGTPAINGSGNVSSITDNGVGDYTVNFTTAMPDADYSFSGSASRSVTTLSREGSSHCVTANDVATARTASLFRIIVQSNNGDGSFDAPRDASYVNVSIFR